MNKIIFLLCFFALLLGGLACNGPEDAGPRQRKAPEQAAAPDTFSSDSQASQLDTLWVANEGNFSWGFGTLTLIDLNTGETRQEVFRSANGFSVGNVLQSLHIEGSQAFLVVNNSAKVVRASYPGFEHEKTASPMGAPRYLQPIGEEKALVTELFGEEVHLLNRQTMKKSSSLPAPAWTERMLPAAGYIFLEARQSEFSQRPDTLNGFRYLPGSASLEPLPSLGQKARGLARDTLGRIWTVVERSGRKWLSSWWAQDGAVGPRFPLDSLKGEVRWLEYAPQRNCLYLLAGDLYAFRFSSQQQRVVVPAEGRNFYGFKRHPENGDLFLSDAKDFVQEGTLYRFSPEGQQKARYSVGVIPGQMVLH